MRKDEEKLESSSLIVAMLCRLEAVSATIQTATTAPTVEVLSSSRDIERTPVLVRLPAAAPVTNAPMSRTAAATVSAMPNRGGCAPTVSWKDGPSEDRCSMIHSQPVVCWEKLCSPSLTTRYSVYGRKLPKISSPAATSASRAAATENPCTPGRCGGGGGWW